MVVLMQTPLSRRFSVQIRYRRCHCRFQHTVVVATHVPYVPHVAHLLIEIVRKSVKITK